MPLPLPLYAKIKDNYCIAYFGNNQEHLVQLRLLRPFMESTFPGVKVFLSCRKDHSYLLQREERIITKEELEENKNQFGYVRELVCDMQSNPIEDFMNESNIPYGPIVKKLNDRISSDCFLLTNGVEPVKSLSAKQIKLAIDYIKKNNRGIEPILNTYPENTHGWVVGVECPILYKAAAQGDPVTLVPTGFGENLFKKMYPCSTILKLEA